MIRIEPARLKPGVTPESLPDVDPRIAGQRDDLIHGRALIFWDPMSLPGTRLARKLNAIDTDQITPAADCERRLPDREVDPAGCRARIMALERRLRMAAGERRTIHFAFTNEGSETWPWDAELGPPIRATYRVLDTAGRVVIGDGPRTAFPCAVGPGEQTVVPLDVIAPVRPGRYVVEADAVHEGVRWFDCPGRCEIEVAPPSTDRDVRWNVKMPIVKNRMKLSTPRLVLRITPKTR